MTLFQNLFGKTTEKKKRDILSHPADLDIGDIIKFSFLPQQDLSNQKFEVISVNVYDFENEQTTSFTLKDAKGHIIWLSVIEDEGEEYVSLSKKMTRNNIKELFTEDQFSEIFEDHFDMKLEKKVDIEPFDQWLVDTYSKEEHGSQGYYHEGDYRDRALPQFEDESLGLDYYLLLNDTESHAIEVEVYKNGDTEISATIYHDLSAIEEMWPAQ